MRMNETSQPPSNTKNMVLSKFETGKKSERGIPEVTFVKDIPEFCGEDDIDSVMNKFQEYYSKYKLMEMNLVSQRAALKRKIPEIKKSLQVVRYLQDMNEAGEAFDTNYEVADNVYATATVDKTDSVCLWLGANVMLEYTLEEADALLSGNLDTADANMIKNQEDLDFTKDQITTCQVNMSRLYNHEVKERRKKAQGK
eukprot:TRINITY_DN1100_c0_g2_i1.p1 TRINITY_DN1100_c0_g2~~TRINITY_DN1100_c0_g2_i1.p1  ORF type:complete len:198 (+),score=58.24 TRINITY_DN1100_c0_g2_i1:221-814(+)